MPTLSFIRTAICTTILSSLVALPLAASAAEISGTDPVVSTGKVYRTLDGDTFLVNLSDRAAYNRLYKEAKGDADRERYFHDRYNSIRVRLASVNTAESVHRNESLNTRAGQRVSDMVTTLTEGKTAKVDCYDWGKHGRVICNLAIRDNGWADISGWLIEHGLSPYNTYFGNNPFYHNEYKQLEANAS